MQGHWNTVTECLVVDHIHDEECDDYGYVAPASRTINVYEYNCEMSNHDVPVNLGV